jgi:glycerol dehydrogenase
MIIFGSPRRYLQGPDAITKLGEEVGRIGKTAVLVADSRVLALIGAAAKESCASAGIALTEIVFGGEITHAEVERMAALCAANPPEVVIAAGGGKTIDAGKFLSGKIKAKLVTVPTVASNDSPTSHIIVVYDESHKLTGVEKLSANPDLVLVDTAVIAKAPAVLLAAGIGDAIVKRFEVEQCVGVRGNNVFGGRSPRTALALAHACYETVRADAVAGLAAVERGQPDEALERLVEACVLMSGLAFESGGLSVCHAMTRGLSAVPGPASALHGHQVAYGLLVQLTLEGRDSAFVADIRRFFGQVGLPVSLAEIGFAGGAAEIATIAELTAQAAHMKHFSRPVAAEDLVAAINAVEAAAPVKQDAAE